MKRLFTLILLAVAFSASAQDPVYTSDFKKEPATSDPTNTPKKKDTTIIIETGLPTEEAFMRWGKHLAQSGYSIDDSNKDFFTLTTKPKDTSKLNFNYIVSSAVDEQGRIKLNMRWQLKSSFLAGTSETGYYDWEFRNEGYHVTGIVYKDVMAVVKNFGDYPVTYTK